MATDRPIGECANVLHTLRCAGVVSTGRLATASGLAHAMAKECLERLGAIGLTSLAPGPFGGWGITAAGKAADDEWLVWQLETFGGRERIRSHYELFLGLNPKLLQVCSDWQIRLVGKTPTLNDHSDPDYDGNVLSRLMRIDGSVQTLCVGLTTILDRFSVYSERLSYAVDRALAGDHSFVADGLDSYHTVWFQLHEDLLTTLGISREEERRDTARG